MMNAGQHLSRGRNSGFTLLEILTATLMFTIIIGALYSVFYGAIRMREKAYKTFEKGLPRAYVSSVIRKDLLSLLPSSGLFSGALIGENEEENGVRRDTIEFYTSSGIVTDASPWGDIRHVKYSLATRDELGEEKKEDSSTLAAVDLIRTVTDNLLQTEEEEPRIEHLLHGVQSLEIAYYDGEYWEDSWDATTQTDETVEAVSMLISFDPQSATDTQPDLPIRLVVPLIIESASSESSSSSSSGGSSTGGGSSGGGSTGGGSGGGGGGGSGTGGMK